MLWHARIVLLFFFFPKRLFSNWKPLSLVTLNTGFSFQMNCANECTSSDCRGSVDRRVGSEYRSLKGVISGGGYSTLQSVLYRAAELRCIWRSSLGRLMAHCEENVPRRDRTEIKWAASLPSLVWLVVLSRHLTLRGTRGLASVSISAPGMMQGCDIHFWHPGGIISHAVIVRCAPHISMPGHLGSLAMAGGVFGHVAPRWKPAVRWSHSSLWFTDVGGKYQHLPYLLVSNLSKHIKK